MHPNEIRPGCRALALWRRRQRVALQDIADRLIADLVPKIGQRPRNPVITPVTVLLGHANDQLLNCVWRGLQAAVACHGHSGQADCTPIAVAESVCRETDRHDPTGMSRPHDRIWGSAPAPGPGSYAAYYNESRIHRSLDKDAPFHRAIERFGVITSRPVLGGLHHQYCRI